MLQIKIINKDKETRDKQFKLVSKIIDNKPDEVKQQCVVVIVDNNTFAINFKDTEDDDAGDYTILSEIVNQNIISEKDLYQAILSSKCNMHYTES